MAERKGKFGLTYNETKAASERWRKIVNDCEWETFDDYLLWMIDSDWQKGKHIGKKDPDKPHGPRNSIWLTPSREHMAEVASSIPRVGNAHCDACEKNGSEGCEGLGCAEWRKYFQENWDRNLHRKVKRDEDKSVVEQFVYYHPDDIREGRV